MGLFRRSKASLHPLAGTAVWIVPLHIKAGAEQLPAPLIGAYVQVFCRGQDANLAAWAAIQAIETMGFSVHENPTTVHQMPAAQYQDYVSENWPELKASFPGQAEFYERMTENRAVISPFAGYDTIA